MKELSEEEIKRCQVGLDSINRFIKEEKRKFTEGFYKDKPLLGMKLAERQKVQADFNEQWTKKEDELYDIIVKYSNKSKSPTA